ncbi:acyl carrier protein [Micromonospora sp. NPDC050200]|uniref:acyl carrier protein n=1 Tax=Micromonospora sp. NPDC050200 TaxID=3155664 RepID=UPI00340EC199
MAYAETYADIGDKLLRFIQDNLLPDELMAGFGPDTPLLESGILDSLSTARLLNFIRDEFGTTVPLSMIDALSFENVESIVAMIGRIGPVGRSD